jgi:tryptophan-rich sensory protein
MSTFDAVAKPPLYPPGWLFPAVWTVLYILMGIASYLIYTSNSFNKKQALLFYSAQFAVNFFWSIIFFNLNAYLFAFIWLLLLWVLVLITLVKFYKINENAGLLLIPYLVWVAFAGYLNLGIALLN